MEIIFLLFKQNVVMAIYLFIGFLLFRKKLITLTGSGELGKILLYLVMPTAIIKSFMRDFSLEMLEGAAISFLAAVLALMVSVLIARAFFRKDAIEHFSAAFSNAGFIGIPLVQMVLGDEAVFYIASFVAVLNILQWTYGVAVITEGRDNISAKKIITNPIVISFLLGLLLFFMPVKLPDIFTEIVGTVASMNGPLAMIVLGVYLAQLTLKELFSDKKVYLCCLVRLIIIPCTTMLVLSFLPERYFMIKMAVMIAASAPVGTNVAIFAQLSGKNYRQAVKNICLSTLFCVAIMPVILGIANALW